MRKGTECGMSFDGFDDVQVDDKIQCFTMVQVPATLKWGRSQAAAVSIGADGFACMLGLVCANGPPRPRSDLTRRLYLLGLFGVQRIKCLCSTIPLASKSTKQVGQSMVSIKTLPPQANETGYPSLAHTSYNGILNKNEVLWQLSQCIYVYPSFLLLSVYGFTWTISTRCCSRTCNLDQVDTKMVSNNLAYGAVEKSRPSWKHPLDLFQPCMRRPCLSISRP